MIKSVLPSYEIVDDERTAQLAKLYGGTIKEYVQVCDKRWFLPKSYIEHVDFYYNCPVRSDDIWLVTHPRSGTTWTQELLWLINNNLNFDKAKEYTLDVRFPNLELNILYDRTLLQNCRDNEPELEPIVTKFEKRSYDIINALQPPRFIHSHLPFSLIPNVLKSGCKVVYTARNPKDVIVSSFYFYKDFTCISFQGTFAEFVDYFINSYVFWSPYWEHVKEAWIQRNNPNFLFLFYEELNHDLPAAIDKVCKFFGKSYTDEELSNLAEHLSFRSFKTNKAINFALIDKKQFIKNNTFIRKGKSNVKHKEFTPELEAKVDKWIAENLKDTDLTFPLFYTDQGSEI